MARFAAAAAALIALLALLLGLTFDAPDARRAIWVSAAVAFAVQLVTFAIARLVAADNLFAGWGVGVLLRLATLAVYAFLALEALALPPVAALVSLAAFLFVTTLVEPLLLRS